MAKPHLEIELGTLTSAPATTGGLMVTLYTITLTVACCVAVALVLGAERRGRSSDARGVTTSTFAVLAATCATLSTLAYAMAGANDENILPLVIGDVSMPLCIGLLLAAVRRATGMKHALALTSVAMSFAAGTTTLLVSPDAGHVVKLIVVALLCAATVYVCVREPLPDLGAWLVGVSVAAYGSYCLLRLVGPTFLSEDALFVRTVLYQGPSTAAAAVVVGVCAAGLIVIIRRSDTTEPPSLVSSEALTNWIEALLAQRNEVVAITVAVPDLPLHRAAFGRAWAQAISAALTEALRTVLPTGSVIGRAAPSALVALQFGPPLDIDTIGARLRESYEGMLLPSAPTDPPDVRVTRLTITTMSDLRRFARHARVTARRSFSGQGV